ncbi:hypothetical protein FHT16_000344 [Xanthomonas arboricola]
MRASRVLQKCLPDSLGQMHALRECALLQAVEALLQGRRLTLTDVARCWPGAERMRAPLKAFDRLLATRTCRPSASRSIRRWRAGCCAVHSRSSSSTGRT